MRQNESRPASDWSRGEGHMRLEEQETSLEHSEALCLRYFQAIAFSRSANRTAALVSCSAVAVARAAVV